MDFLHEYPALLALVIFLARIGDVSIGTLRTILVFRGRSIPAAVLGFFEVLIWITAAGQVIRNLDAWYLTIAYAGGFAMGNIVGIWLESKLAMGFELVRAISDRSDVNLAERLREAGFNVAEIEARTHKEAPIEVLLVIEKRRNIPRLTRTITEIDPQAVITISDVKTHTPVTARAQRLPIFGGWRTRGKRK